MTEREQLKKQIHLLKSRLGGLARNPKKGFGSGDNARKANLARWSRVKK